MGSMTTYTATEAAAALGCHKSTISRACAEHGIGKRHGTTLLLTAGDLNRLRRLIKHAGGRGKFAVGNDLWKLRGKAEK